jgi:4-hydroxy-2-oxoglutarate aldolase
VRPPGLQGVIAPISTPFDPVTGEIAPVALRHLARALLAAGLEGLVVAGSTGEGELLDDAERVRLVEWLRDVVPDDRWLIAGAGAESTRATLATAQAVAAAGADAVLVRPPSYFSSLLAPAALAEHFARVADGCPVPIIVYNIPRYAHLTLHDSVLRTLDEHRGVLGFKDSSGDLRSFSAYRAAAPRLVPMVGSGHLFYPALEMGAAGGILAMACFAAEPCVALYAAFRAGDRQTAGGLQERLSPLAREIVGALGPAGIKAAMDEVGLPGGPVRSPLQPLDARRRARVAECLATAGLKAAA